jgi:NCS1 family nucleobase:cation symporter-1
VTSLYIRNGPYEYQGGVNRSALLSLAAGVILALVGLVCSPLRWLYNYSWFVGFAVAGATYWISMCRRSLPMESAEMIEGVE